MNESLRNEILLLILVIVIAAILVIKSKPVQRRVLLVGYGWCVFMNAALYFFRFRFGFFETIIGSAVIYYSLAWLLGLLRVPKSN